MFINIQKEYILVYTSADRNKIHDFPSRRSILKILFKLASYPYSFLKTPNTATKPHKSEHINIENSGHEFSNYINLVASADNYTSFIKFLLPRLVYFRHVDSTPCSSYRRNSSQLLARRKRRKKKRIERRGEAPSKSELSLSLTHMCKCVYSCERICGGKTSITAKGN